MQAIWCGKWADFVRGLALYQRDNETSPRHCERSEAIQTISAETAWIASSQGLLAMTECG
jgi:hypothetical protein